MCLEISRHHQTTNLYIVAAFFCFLGLNVWIYQKVNCCVVLYLHRQHSFEVQELYITTLEDVHTAVRDENGTIKSWKNGDVAYKGASLFATVTNV